MEILYSFLTQPLVKHSLSASISSSRAKPLACVRGVALSPTTFRLVTNLELDRRKLDAAKEKIRAVLGQLLLCCDLPEDETF